MFKKSIPPALAGVGASILIFSVALLSALLLYTRSLAGHKQDFRDDLLHSAQVAATLVDVKTHNSFVTPAQETTATYLAAIAVLDRVKNANKGMKFIYTCILRHDSIFFVLDPTPAGDADSDGIDDKSHIMQEYPDAGEACRKALRTGTPVADDEPYTDAWGTFMSAYAPFFDERGKLVGVVGVDKELTQYTSEAKGMREAGWIGLGIGLVLSLLVGMGVHLGVRALQKADRQRQTALEAAEKAARVKAEFLALMSHEIRTPLSGVIGMLDSLVRSGLEGRRLDMAAKALTGAESMLALLNDILDFSKIEAGGISLEAAPFDALELCRDALALFRPKAEAKGLALAMRAGDAADPSGAGGVFRVVGDSARLRQVLLNLIGNAVKFTPSGQVTLILRRQGPTLEFSVEDTGIGISEDKQGALFQSFSQADVSTTRVYGGTGLGLAICKRLVELMGGNIGVTSAAGKGSVFRFTLPLPATTLPLPAAVPADPIPLPAGDPGSAGSDPPHRASHGRFRGLRILLVEDDAVNREVANLLLEEMEFRVDLAMNGREALALAGAHDYAAILMDCRMPEMDGFQAAAAIRRLSGPRASVPIVAMTANTLDGDKAACLEAGMDDYLAKPVRWEKLQAVMRRWCRVGPQPDPSPEPTRGSAAAASDGVPSVDPAVIAGLREMAGDGSAAFLAKVIRIFLESWPQNLADMEKLLAARDGKALGDLAHGLRGSGGSLGALRLTHLCRSLERAVEEGKWDEAAGFLAAIRRELPLADLELRSFLTSK